MADYRAIEGASEALVYLLRLNYDSAHFDGMGLQIEPYVTQDFAEPMSAGVSFFLYRITINGSDRTPAGRLNPDGGRDPARLPLDLRYMLTGWASDATLEHRILGWAMRTLEDTPVVPHGVLESAAPGVFRPDESLEIVADDLPNEDLLRIWEVLGQNVSYRLSVPYLVRNVRVETMQPVPVDGAPMQERVFDYRDAPGEGGPSGDAGASP